MLKLVSTVAFAGVVLAVQIAEAGSVTVPAPPAVGLLTAGAAVIALGSWWRSRRK